MVAATCVFLQVGALGEISSPDAAVASTPIRAPLVLTDLSTPPADAATLRSTARLLAPSCDALLVGDHQDRPDYPPSTLARPIADAGAVPWVTLACRDRNRIALEQELRGLAVDRLATVLCVTGDGRAFDVRPDVTQAFDLDGTRLAALAASLGLPVAVAETPTAPPVEFRPRRLVHKQRVGAAAGVLNHVPTLAQVTAFLDAARSAGLTMPVVASAALRRPASGSTRSPPEQTGTRRSTRSGSAVATCWATYPPYDAPTSANEVRHSCSTSAKTSSASP